MSDGIDQRLLPSPWLAKIPIRTYSRSQAGSAADALADFSLEFVGIAIKLSSKGKVERVALASSKQVFIIDTASDGHLLAEEQFIRLLSSGTLVGFEMARLALFIHRDLKHHVNGVDLTTLFSPTSEPWSPSNTVKFKIGSCRDLALDNLWGYGREDRYREVALRSWISAWYFPFVFDRSANDQTYYLKYCRKIKGRVKMRRTRQCQDKFEAHKTHGLSLTLVPLIQRQ